MEIVTMLDRSTALGGVVRVARRHAGLTQAALADRLGTSQPVVSRWERGADEPRLSTLREIAAACGLRATLVLDEDVDRAQIREHLAMTPTQRLQSVANAARLRERARPVTAARR